MLKFLVLTLISFSTFAAPPILFKKQKFILSITRECSFYGNKVVINTFDGDVNIGTKTHSTAYSTKKLESLIKEADLQGDSLSYEIAAFEGLNSSSTSGSYPLDYGYRQEVWFRIYEARRGKVGTLQGQAANEINEFANKYCPDIE